MVEELAHARTVPVNVRMKSSGLTIGELADRFGLATHVLRHWESKGLLAPRRVAGGQRRYTESDVTRVAMILIGKEAGFELGDLRTLLDGGDPRRHTDLLHRHLAALQEPTDRAAASKELIEHGLACPEPFDTCPHARQHIAAHIPG
ncbi:MerR family transcriptional regulator [Virgisporangium ochraceum]